MVQIDEALGSRLGHLQQRALIVGIAGLIIGLAGAFFNRTQFFQSYLFAYVFWVQLSLGCLMVLMLQHVAGGGWGFVIRRPLEAGMMTLPLMALLFIPLVFVMPDLYPWARPEEVAGSPLLQHKAPYLNVPFFVIRTVVYFAIWIGLAYALNKWSREQDDNPAVGLARFQRLSGPGLALTSFSITFASFDWMMSLEPEWFSTIYGFMFAVGAGTAAFATGVIVLAWLAQFKPLSGVVTVGHFNDLGNFLLASVMLWAYMSLSQYLIIWSGNLPEEITWYVSRTRGGWQGVGLFVVIFHFALPFLALLSRGVKRRRQALVIVAGLILFTRLVDLYWLVIPAFYPGGLHLDWLTIVLPVAMGGLWLAVFIRQLQRKSLVAVNDPHLQEMSKHGHHETAGQPSGNV
jgi:hypothetical protein